MNLKRKAEASRILDPSSAFSEAVQHVEVRIDPLTGIASRINVMRAKRPKHEPMGLAQMAAKACSFCPDRVESDTPKFPPDIIPEGRIRHGNAILFPNLFPLSSLHGVCVFSQKHLLEPEALSKEEISDGIESCRIFFQKAEKLGLPYHFLGWNHLSPAAASIPHPHFQAMASNNIFRWLRYYAKASNRYWKRKGSSFWSDLLASEGTSPRYIGKTNGFLWFAPWAPLGSYEVIGLHEGLKASLFKLEGSEVEGLADGITRFLKGLASLGLSSVNMAVFSMPVQIHADWFALHVRLMARPSPSDRGFLELYGGEVGVTTLPEDYAKVFRGYF